VLEAVIAPARAQNRRSSMNEDIFNTAIRKFLKEVGVTSQREIEKAVRDGVASGKLKGSETLPVKVTLTLGQTGLTHVVDGEIKLGLKKSFRALRSRPGMTATSSIGECALPAAAQAALTVARNLSTSTLR
jgi:hypothetical protein